MSPPVTLLEYLLLVLRRLPSALTLGLFVRILIAAPLAGLALLAHTFLLVVMNEGFSDGGTMWGTVLALSGTRWLTGTALWGLVAYLATTLLTRALMQGVGPLMRQLASVPGWIAQTARDAGPAGIAVLAGAFAIGEFGGTVLGNRPLLLTLFFGGWLALSSGRAGTLITVCRLAWWDIERLTRSGHPNHDFHPERIVVLQVGLVFGVLRAATLPFQPGIGLFGGLALGLVALVLLGLSIRRSPLLGAVLGAFLLDALFRAPLAFADDGGWAEAGGTFAGWIGSPGAIEAILHGVPPALSTFIGIIVGSQTGVLPEVQLPDRWGPSERKPYWGDGSVEHPFTDMDPLDGSEPTGWLGDETGEPTEGEVSPAMPGDELGFPDEEGEDDIPDKGETDGGEADKPQGDDAPESSDDGGDAPPGDGEGEPAGDEAPGDGKDEPAGDEAPGDGKDEPAGDEAPGEGKDDPAGDDRDGADEDVTGDDDKPVQEPAPDEAQAGDEGEEDAEEDEEEVPPLQPKDLTPAELAELTKKLQKIIDDKAKEGFYVRNPNLLKKALNNTIGRPWDWAWGNTGGQCGEFGEWGAEWSKPMLEKMFGKGVAVDTIYVEEASTADPQGWADDIDGLVTGNHRATRVVLPNGQRFVLDYWECMGRGDGKAKMVTEKEWVDNWHKEFGSDFKAQVAHPENSEDMAAFKRAMESGHMQGKSDAYKLKVLKSSYGDKTETYLNSWNKDPW